MAVMFVYVFKKPKQCQCYTISSVKASLCQSLEHSNCSPACSCPLCSFPLPLLSAFFSPTSNLIVFYHRLRLKPLVGPNMRRPLLLQPLHPFTSPQMGDQGQVYDHTGKTNPSPDRWHESSSVCLIISQIPTDCGPHGSPIIAAALLNAHCNSIISQTFIIIIIFILITITIIIIIIVIIIIYV